jgi:hypothetical protein
MNVATPRREHTDLFEDERHAHWDLCENDGTASAGARTRQLVLAWRLGSLWWTLETTRVERESLRAPHISRGCEPGRLRANCTR